MIPLRYATFVATSLRHHRPLRQHVTFAMSTTATGTRNTTANGENFNIDQIRSELVPTGTLRAGLNMSNALLITGRDPVTDRPTGVAPDLVLKLAEVLDVPSDQVRFVEYPRPNHLAAAALENEWDVACLGAEPSRAREIWFTPPYVEIETTYLVPPSSSGEIRSIRDVDRPGVRIAVPEGSAYDLFLTRQLRSATLVRAAGGLDPAFDLFVGEKCDALAGLRPRLMEDQKKMEGSRLLPGKFHSVQQAMGVPRREGEATSDADDQMARAEECRRFLSSFIEGCKRDGLVLAWMKRHGVEDKLAVANTQDTGR